MSVLLHICLLQAQSRPLLQEAAEAVLMGRYSSWPHKGPGGGRQGRPGSQMGARSWQGPGAHSSGIEYVRLGLFAWVPEAVGGSRRESGPLCPWERQCLLGSQSGS